MDDIQDYLTTFYSLCTRHSSTVGSILSTINQFSQLLNTYLYPPMNKLVRTLAEKPDVASVLLLIVLLFVSLKLLNLLYQAVMFWVRLVFRLVFWSLLIGVVVWVCTRGPDGVVDDMHRLAGLWSDEYQYWKARESEAWTAKPTKGYGDGFKPYGRGRANGWW